MSSYLDPEPKKRWSHLASHLPHLPHALGITLYLAHSPVIRTIAVMVAALGLLFALGFRRTRGRLPLSLDLR